MIPQKLQSDFCFVSQKDRFFNFRARLVLPRSLADHLACSFPEANTGMATEEERIELSVTEQAAERAHSLTMRVLYCQIFLQQHIISATGVLSDS